jgi:hypothetical protein
MADRDFNIKIVTSADLSGLAQTEAGLSRLKDQARIASLPGRGFALGGAFGVGSASAQEIEAAAVPAAEATGEIASASLLAGANLARARNEAVTFVRELASGAPTARTLGALLGSLGPSLIGGAVGGLVLKGRIDALTESVKKTTAELDKETARVVDLANKWHEVAQAASSQDDVQRLGRSTLGEIEKSHERVRQSMQEELGLFDKISDAINHAYGLGTPYQAQLDERIRGEQLISEILEKQANASVREADERQKAFDLLKSQPFEETIPKLTADIASLQAQQDGLNRRAADFDAQYVKIGNKIEIAKGHLNELLQLQKEANREADEVLKRADLQTKSIVANDQAAAAARAAGNERDAAMFQKSAEQFRAGATPQQKALADWIEKEQGLPQAPQPLTPQQQIDANKKAYEAAFPGALTPPTTPTEDVRRLGMDAERARQEEIESARRQGHLGEAARSAQETVDAVKDLGNIHKEDFKKEEPPQAKPSPLPSPQLDAIIGKLSTLITLWT